MGQPQLKADNREKMGLLTDGKISYLGLEQNGRYALGAMPVYGGPIRVLWNPQANVLPINMSPDGKELLALCGRGVEEEREIWIGPLGSGVPRRQLNIVAHAAAGAPDGKTTAYASGTEIYLISKDQTAARRAGRFAGAPRALNWSQDGQYRHVSLDSAFIINALLWGQLSGDGMKKTAMRTLTTKCDFR